MISKRITQIEIIQDTDATSFKQKVNNRLNEIENVLELTFPEGSGFNALIKYEIAKEIPECPSDEYYARYHKHYICNDCPFLKLDIDRRSLTHWCDLHKDRMTLRTPCCDDFYTGLMNGQYHLVTPEERERQRSERDQYELDRRKEHARINQMVSKERRKADIQNIKYSMNKPRYCFEYIETDNAKLERISNSILSAEELAVIIYGKVMDLKESTLIDIAKRTGAAVLWKTDSLLDGNVTDLYVKEGIQD